MRVNDMRIFIYLKYTYVILFIVANNLSDYSTFFCLKKMLLVTFGKAESTPIFPLVFSVFPVQQIMDCCIIGMIIFP